MLQAANLMILSLTFAFCPFIWKSHLKGPSGWRTSAGCLKGDHPSQFPLDAVSAQSDDVLLSIICYLFFYFGLPQTLTTHAKLKIRLLQIILQTVWNKSEDRKI